MSNLIHKNDFLEIFILNKKLKVLGGCHTLEEEKYS